jgi:hypothetical protein
MTTTAAVDKASRAGERNGRRPSDGSRERRKEGAERAQQESLKDQARDAHEEARMVLPGIQALFGFQLIAVFNPPFFDLDPGDRALHLASLVLVAVAIGLIMAPASYRRLAEATRISTRWVRLASRCIASAMGTLLIAIAIDIYLVAMMIARDERVAVPVALGTAALLGWMWFGLPLLRKRRERSAGG